MASRWRLLDALASLFIEFSEHIPVFLAIAFDKMMYVSLFLLHSILLPFDDCKLDYCKHLFLYYLELVFQYSYFNSVFILSKIRLQSTCFQNTLIRPLCMFFYFLISRDTEYQTDLSIWSWFGCRGMGKSFATRVGRFGIKWILRIRHPNLVSHRNWLLW